MHFLTLVTLEIPKLENDYKTDMLYQDVLQELQERHDKDPKNLVTNFYLEKFNGLKTAFARTVDAMIEDKLEPYCESTENPDYLEFEDQTDELRREYEEESVDCIKLPDGRIVSVYDQFVMNRFAIHEGKVFEKHIGSLKFDKRTKKAKKMTAMPKYPYKKLYKTFESFAEKERYMDYNEEFDGYGYAYNPNAFWDWYQIGGRWPNVFLVRETCEECSEGEHSWTCQDSKPASPQGYKWVCAARKKDIDWQAMYDWKIKTESENYELYKHIFTTGEKPQNFFCHISDNGILEFDSYLYIKDESLDEYLTRHGFFSKYQYPNLAHAFLDQGEYYSQDDNWTNKQSPEERKEAWHKILDHYICSIPNESVMVGVDCHI